MIRRVWNVWDQFWFGERSLLNLAVFRIILMLSMASLYWGRLFDVAKYYTDTGLLPKGLALQVYPEFYRPSFLLAAWPDSWVWPLHFFLVIGSLALAAGIGGRLLNLVLWFLHLAFLQRNYSLAFGGDLIGGIFLMLMIGTQSCARLNVLRLFKKPKTSVAAVKSDLFTNLFYRLIQAQLMIIYLWTGFEKLKGASWWDGTALWTVFANPQMVIFDMTWLRNVPVVIALLTISTVLFEIYFPALVMNKATRKWCLLFGLGLHFGIGLLVAIWSFSFIMIAPYILWMDEEWTNRLIKSLKTQSKKLVSN